MDTRRAINLFKELAGAAGEKILEIYREGFTVDYKEDDSPVTEADKTSNELIVQGLKDEYPQIPVLAEESADDLSRLSKEYCFIVDPLDGTKEFVKKSGEFTVNIALARSGVPIAGLIYAPILREYYYASENQGAWWHKEKEKERPLRVSDRTGDIRLAVSRSHRTRELDRLIEVNGIKNIIVAGSAYKGCLFARGDVEAYYRFGKTMEWDTAPMQIIAVEAGGIFMGMNGRPFTYNKANSENPTGFFMINRMENWLTY
ncbi:MAG: 3'(2'),5'-bisphosphate nucleotidase CysQ [Clostridiaceae bacterium]|jgi:3'(2'), 5'-bisphosphate nucleotidase|nr:3'(2'),5'-bisphosphate nucleotidase CysQ [Bacillota bacterium]NLI39179.1 3'(2'),5'-bisphosphate nucleotidase CysQ [Clostridiaceae bacterium]